MGKKSRLKRDRRKDPDYAVRRRVARAERRGRQVDATLEAYADVHEKRGVDGPIEALIARHNVRWEGLHGQSNRLAHLALPGLTRVPIIDAALMLGGASRDRFPGSYLGAWPDHLGWAADSAVATIRLVMAGQAIGAAGIARQQLERWTENLAHNRGLTQGADELIADYIGRVWEGLEAPGFSTAHAYNDLSELLHGRGGYLALVHWETDRLCQTVPAPEVERLISSLVETVRHALKQVYVCATELPGARHLRDIEWPETAPLTGEVKLITPTLWPMEHKYLDRFPAESMTIYAETYRRRIMRPWSMNDHDLAALEAFLERRERTYRWETKAREDERRALGDEFDSGKLSARLSTYVVVAEAAALAGRWHGGYRQEALATAASAARSATLLWLEDDDRAMVPVRTMIAMTARVRAARLKPNRAAELEILGARASARDWLEAAGWRRLSALSRALGALSHGQLNARWDGARDVLAALADPPDGVEAVHIARGSALDTAVRFLAVEVIGQLEELGTPLAKAVAEAVGLDKVEAAEEMERQLNRVWAARNLGLGAPIFRRMAPLQRLV